MRAARPLLALLVSASLVGALGVQPASAVLTKQVVISKSQPTKVTLGPIAANGAAASTSPTGCGHPLGSNRFERTCDNVPLVIEDPKLGPTEDYFVTIKVTWEPNTEVEGEAGANDLDVYLYDDRQIRARKDSGCADPKATVGKDGATCFTKVGQSASAVQPETIKLFSPEPLVNYNLVVVNYTGPNISYTIEGDIKLESFDAPFEDLGPSFGNRSKAAQKQDAQEKASFVPPIDLSGDDPPTGGGDRSAGTGGGAGLGDVGDILAGARGLDEVPILPDADFGTARPSTTDSFGAPSALASQGATRSIAAAGPVSAALVIFWLVLVPLVLVVGGVLWIVRRSRKAFVYA